MGEGEGEGEGDRELPTTEKRRKKKKRRGREREGGEGVRRGEGGRRRGRRRKEKETSLGSSMSSFQSAINFPPSAPNTNVFEKRRIKDRTEQITTKERENDEITLCNVLRIRKKEEKEMEKEVEVEGEMRWTREETRRSRGLFRNDFSKY